MVFHSERLFSKREASIGFGDPVFWFAALTIKLLKMFNVLIHPSKICFILLNQMRGVLQEKTENCEEGTLREVQDPDPRFS